MQKTQEALAQSGFRSWHTHRVFDYGTLSWHSLVRSVALGGRTLTSMDHYAEGLGIYVGNDLADVGKNGSQPNN